MAHLVDEKFNDNDPSEEEVQKEISLIRKELSSSQKSLRAWRGLQLGINRIHDIENYIFLVFDTNRLISNGGKLLTSIVKNPQFQKFIVYLPWMVLQELDHLTKSSERYVKMTARRVAVKINEYFNSHHERVIGQNVEQFNRAGKKFHVENAIPDDRIMQACLLLMDEGKNVQLFTEDTMFKVKARSNGIVIFDYDNPVIDHFGSQKLREQPKPAKDHKKKDDVKNPPKTNTPAQGRLERMRDKLNQATSLEAVLDNPRPIPPEDIPTVPLSKENEELPPGIQNTKDQIFPEISSFTRSVKGIHDQTDRALDELVARNKERFYSTSSNPMSVLQELPEADPGFVEGGCSLSSNAKPASNQADDALDDLVARNKAQFCPKNVKAISIQYSTESDPGFVGKGCSLSSYAKSASDQADNALEELVARNKTQFGPPNAKLTSIQDLAEADPGFIGANLLPLPDCLPDNIGKERLDPIDLAEYQPIEFNPNRIEESINEGSDILNHAIESSNDKEYDKSKKSPSRISAKERMALRNAPLQRS